MQVNNKKIIIIKNEATDFHLCKQISTAIQHAALSNLAVRTGTSRMEGSRKSFETFRKSTASLKAKNHNKLFSIGYQESGPYMSFFLKCHFPNESTDQHFYFFFNVKQTQAAPWEENLLTVVRHHRKRWWSSIRDVLHLLLLMEQKRAKWVPPSKRQVEKRSDGSSTRHADVMSRR